MASTHDVLIPLALQQIEAAKKVKSGLVYQRVPVVKREQGEI
ncbi:hypothetical protein FORC066_0865 [Yersinia enterocolitica]|nr:hypothetical protein FORC065_3579 [Yersinia enterocolitica]UXD28081.1 hypothetical protein FORC066_0865 [Yersinia enterocolitica]